MPELASLVTEPEAGGTAACDGDRAGGSVASAEEPTMNMNCRLVSGEHTLVKTSRMESGNPKDRVRRKCS